MFASVINQHSFYSISADVTLSRPNWGQPIVANVTPRALLDIEGSQK